MKTKRSALDPLPCSTKEFEVSRVLIVDDHPGFRRGLASLLARQKDFIICGEAEDPAAALEAMRQLHPSAAVVDISLPGGTGIDLMQVMLAEQPHIKILVVSMHVDPIHLFGAMDAGAKGYVAKTDDASYVVEGLRKVVHGGTYTSPQIERRRADCSRLVTKNNILLKLLTNRERYLLRLTGEGFLNHEAASFMEISMGSFHSHLYSIMKKLKLESTDDFGWFAVEWVISQPRA